MSIDPSSFTEGEDIDEPNRDATRRSPIPERDVSSRDLVQKPKMPRGRVMKESGEGAGCLLFLIAIVVWLI